MSDEATRARQFLMDYREPANRISFANRRVPMTVELSSAGSGRTLLDVEIAVAALSIYDLAVGRYRSYLNGVPTAYYSTRGSSDCSNIAGWASTAFTSHLVLFTLEPSCTVRTTPLDFGLQTLRDEARAQSTLTVNCTADAAYKVTLDNGANGGTGPIDRRLRHATSTATLSYGLYLDSSRLQPWGNTADTMQTGTGDNKDRIFEVFGSIPVQTGKPIGEYRDTVMVTVTY